MRNGQNKRMRGRNRRGHNPMTRVYESNGPDVKIRGTAHHIAEKYLQLARDSQSSGDPVAAEGYLQHAEHYFRLIAAAQSQFQQHQQHNPNQPQQQQQPFQRSDSDSRDDYDNEGDEFGGVDSSGQPYPSGAPVQQMQQPQPQYQPPPNYQGHQQPQPRNDEPGAPGLPAFITGGSGAPGPAQGNGHDNEGEGGDRDNHRRFNRGRNRRFRHRGPNDFDQQRAQGGGDSAPAGEAQPGNEIAPPKPGE